MVIWCIQTRDFTLNVGNSPHETFYDLILAYFSGLSSLASAISLSPLREPELSLISSTCPGYSLFHDFAYAVPSDLPSVSDSPA